MFQKGKSGNPNGRPKGVKNKSTEEIKKIIQQIYSENLEKLPADLAQMKGFQRWVILEKISKYFLPSLTKADVEAEVKGDVKITVEYKNPDE